MKTAFFAALVLGFSGNVCDILSVLKTALHTGHSPACACALATALQTPTAHDTFLASTNACSAAGMGSLNVNVSLILDSGSVFASNIPGSEVCFRIQSKWL